MSTSDMSQFYQLCSTLLIDATPTQPLSTSSADHQEESTPGVSARTQPTTLVATLRRLTAVADTVGTSALPMDPQCWLKVILQGFRRIDSDDEEVLFAFLVLLHTLLKRRLLHSTHYRHQLIAAVPFFLKIASCPPVSSSSTLRSCQRGDVHIQLFRTFTLFFEITGVAYHAYYHQIVDVLEATVFNVIPRNATLCPTAVELLAGLCSGMGTKFPAILTRIIKLNLGLLRQSVAALQTKPSRGIAPGLYRMLTVLLHAIRVCVMEDKRIFTNHVRPLLNQLDVCLYYRLYGYSPTTRTSSESEVTEYGFSDAPGPASHFTRWDSLTVQTLRTLQCVVRHCPRAWHSEWDHYLPETTVDAQPNLFSLLRVVQHPDVQRQVLLTLATFLEHAPALLALADDRVTVTSFTPLAVRVAQMVNELHRRLTQLLVPHGTQLYHPVPVLGCLRALASWVPYVKLQQPLLTNLGNTLGLELGHSRELSNVAAECLAVVTTLLSREDIREIIWDLWITKEAFCVGQKCYSLLPFCQSLVFQPPAPDVEQLRVGAFQVLIRAAWIYPARVLGQLPELLSLVEFHFATQPPTLQTPSLQLLRAFIPSLSATESWDSPLNTITWPSYVDQYMLPTLDSDHAPLRIASYELVAATTPALVKGLRPVQRKILITHLILNGTQHDDSAVQTSAFRTLGFLAALDTFREDLCFVMDVLEKCRQKLTNCSLTLRIKVAWTLANLTDALVWNQTHPDESSDDLGDWLTPSLLQELVNAAEFVLQSDEKMRMSGLRATGNLFYLASSTWFTKYHALVNRVMGSVIKCIKSGPFKVRWNACHDVGRMLANPAFPTDQPYCDWSGGLLKALLCALQQRKNHKVRINAAQALTQPTRWQQYGVRAECWHSLVDTLVSTLHAVLVEFLQELVAVQEVEEVSLGASLEDQVRQAVNTFTVPVGWPGTCRYTVSLVRGLASTMDHLRKLTTDETVTPPVSLVQFDPLLDWVNQLKQVGILPVTEPTQND
ncbi:hypothetical protein IWQ61_000399 [Dispira simplex]|nr:hypothetical protein IWQ61_000399 [Dispira simplex]